MMTRLIPMPNDYNFWTGLICASLMLIAFSFVCVKQEMSEMKEYNRYIRMRNNRRGPSLLSADEQNQL